MVKVKKRVALTAVRGKTSIAVFLLLAGCLLASAVCAQDVRTYSKDTFYQWLQKYADAKPDFKPGDVLTPQDMEKMRPFVPPGYLEQLNFPEFKMTVGGSEDHTPRRDYMDCSEKYQAQVRLRSDGALENYLCGQPFPLSAISSNDPLAGIKAAWNYEYRWQNYGLFSYSLPWMWVRFGGTHSPIAIDYPPPEWSVGIDLSGKMPKDTSEMFGGGGTFQRTLQCFYQRVYFSHLAPLADKGGLLPAPNAQDFEFKEFTGFFGPFDIRGTAFIIYRYSDPYRADDAWAYLPQLRRVRRISVEVKSDSLLGTDHTLEDFYSFSGRILEWKWRFLGFKDVALVMSSQHDYAHYYGPNGIIPNDRWEVKRFAVVERTPTYPRHPYSGALDFWDVQNWDAGMLVTFDRSGKLWKIFQFTKVWSEDIKDPTITSINHGVRSTDFQTVAVMDLQNNRATLNPLYGLGFPDVTPSQVQKLYDIITWSKSIGR